jgi:hypothetical protein
LAGDLHLGSIATSKEMVNNLKDYLLNNPNALLVLMGDEIEGFKAKYASTNVVNSLNLNTQLDYFYHHFFKPLADAGKIACMVSGYWGHPGWAHDDNTLNIWAVMTRYRKDVPIIANGGRLIIKFSNGQKVETQIFHNPPGKSKFDPLHGLRQAAQAQNPANRPDIYTASHLHKAATGKEGSAIFVQAGTAKGSEIGGNTDPFGEKIAASPYTDPWLQGVILQPKKGRHPKQRPEIRVPFITQKQGELVYGALDTLNNAESADLTQELMQQIYHKFPKPEIVNNSRGNKVTSSPADEHRRMKRDWNTKKEDDRLLQNGLKALYLELSYLVDSQLPISIHSFSNARFGSSHESGNNLPIELYHERLARDPYAFTVYLRNMLDSNAVRLSNRLDILERYVDLIKMMDGRTLGVLLDGSLGHKSWLRRIGNDYDHRPIAAGSYLSAETSAKLIHHMSMINLSVGPNNTNKVLYALQTVDRLMGHGSYAAGTKGLHRIYDLYSTNRPSVIMGGHMISSGHSQFFDTTNLHTDTPAVLASGWWSKFADTTGTRSQGGEPGQAVILMPGTKQSDHMVIPTANIEETENLSKALTLLVGVGLLGLKQKLQSKPTRRR